MGGSEHGALHSGFVSVPVTLALVLVALVYTRGWYRLRLCTKSPREAHSPLKKVQRNFLEGHRRPDVIPIWRFAVFVAGLLSVWIAIGSPLAKGDHELLSIHMLQHLLLMAAGAPLILLGAPVLLLRHGLPEVLACRGLPLLLRCSLVRTMGHALTRPAVGWLAGTGAVIAWHIPAAFELGMRSYLWHETQRATFVVAGFLFWWPLIEPWPSHPKSSRWHVPLYLFLGTLPCDALSAFLTFSDRVVYQTYSGSGLDISALQDQETAGALMWVCVTFIYLMPAVVVTIRMLCDASDHVEETYG
jgi:putative membrane protein